MSSRVTETASICACTSMAGYAKSLWRCSASHARRTSSASRAASNPSVDSVNTRPDDARVLDLVIECFGSGPLKGRTIKLVGHADPRGGSDYNLTLGQARADSVAGYMLGKGMDKAKTESTSRGAMDATGTDDPSWARDRRVPVIPGQRRPRTPQ